MAHSKRFTSRALLTALLLALSCKSTTQSTSNSIQINILLPSGFSARMQLFNAYIAIDPISDAGVFSAPFAQQTGVTDDGYSTTTEVANFDNDALYEWLMSISPSPFGAGGTAWQTYVAGSPTGALFRIVAGVQDNSTTKLAEGVAEIDSTGQAIRFGPSERIVTIQLVCTSAAYCGGDAGSAVDAGTDAGTEADAGTGTDAGADAGADAGGASDPLFGSPISFGDPATGDIDTIDVSSDIGRSVAAAWYENPGDGGDPGMVRAVWYRADAGWSVPIVVSTWERGPWDGGGESLSVAAYDAGAAWVAWEAQGSVYARPLSGYTNFASAARIVQDGGSTTFLLAASKTTGQTVLVYQSGVSNVNLFVKKNPEDGGSYGWGPATLVENDDQGNVSDPQIAMNAGGDYVLTWLSWATVNNVWGRRCSFNGGCTGDGGTLLESNSSAAGSPLVGIKDNGDSVVVWTQPTTGTPSLQSSRHTAGTFGTATQFASGSGIANLRFALGTTGGMGYAVWEQGGRIHQQGYSVSTNTWQDAGPVAGSNPTSFGPSVTVETGDENALIAWAQGGVIRLTRMNSVGFEHMSQVRVSSDSDGGIVAEPRVMEGPNGKAVILWLCTEGARWNLCGNAVDLN